MPSRRFSPVRKTATIFLIMSMAVTACANPRAQYISAQDECSQFREPFVQIKERQQQQIQEWATAGGAVGAAGGAVAGAVIARNRGQNAIAGALIGALAGAAAGALAGAALGYYNNLQERKSTTASLRNAVYSDAKSDARTGDRLLDAVVDLNTCRLQSIERVAADVQRGAPKEDARNQLAQIRAASDADNELINSVTSGIQERNKIYVNALSKSGADNADTFVASINTYEPEIEPAEFTVARAGGGTKVLRNSNVRSGPGIKNEKIATLRKGTEVTILGREGGWNRIEFDGREGYTAASNFRKSTRSGSRAATIRKRNRKQSRNAVTRSEARSKEIQAVQDANSQAIKQSLQDTELLLS